MAGQGMRGARQGAGAGNRADLGGLWVFGSWGLGRGLWVLGLWVFVNLGHFAIL
jgi:hypothetical protein